MGRLVTRQTILVLFILFGHLNLGACAGFALANCDWLGRTIAFYQVFFQQGRVALGKWCIGPQKGHPGLPRDGVFLYSSQASFSWPGVDLARLLRWACSRSFGLYPSSLSKSVGLVSLSGKASWVSISAAILFLLYFYDPGMFVRISWKTVCWKGAWRRLLPCLKLMSVSYLVYYYCI